MNVRDFLYNFIDKRETKIAVKNYNEKVLYYGYADALDDIEILNRNVDAVNYDLSFRGLCIYVNGNSTKVIFHLPENSDHVY